MGGGLRGRRRWPDQDSSTAPSLCSSPRPHFPPPLTPSSILCGPSVLTPGVVPLPSLRAITTPPRPPRELSPPAHGSEGWLCLGGFFLGFLGWQSSEKGVRVPERRPRPAACPAAGAPSGLGVLAALLPQP